MSATTQPTTPNPQKSTVKSNGKGTADQQEHPFADTIKDSLHKSVDILAEKAAAAETTVRSSAAKGGEAIVENREKAEKAWNKSAIKQYATENPVATAGIAFALGALAASLIKRN